MLEQSQREAAQGLQTPSLSGGWTSREFYADQPPLQITGISATRPLSESPEVVVRTLAPYVPTTVPTVAAPTEATQPTPPVTYVPGHLEEQEARREHLSRRLIGLEEEGEEEEMEEEDEPGNIPAIPVTGARKPRRQLEEALDFLGSRPLTQQEMAAVHMAEKTLNAQQPKMMTASQTPGVRSIRYRALMHILRTRMGLWKHIQELQNTMRSLGYIVPRGSILPAYPRLNMTTDEVLYANRLAGNLLRR